MTVRKEIGGISPTRYKGSQNISVITTEHCHRDKLTDKWTFLNHKTLLK